MLEAVLLICAAMALAFAINLAPAFMPSTWMVMAFFYIRFDLPLLVLTLGSAVASALGRMVLAWESHAFSRRFMPGQRQDLDELGAFLDEHRQVIGPAVFLYALSPLPTNNLFIAAGMTGVSMTAVVAGFVASRMIANTFWVWTTHKAFDSLGSLFTDAMTGPIGITLEIAGLVAVVLTFRLPWARWLRRATRR
ncbi:MAG: hypothetical protein EPO22_06545 [Dehalococcoidia bacterium]|nr:MAG: hypothetical protein EPO22_06545 [Dehalococcoidia bacterium]